MKVLIIILGCLMLSGCGIYIHRGEGSYAFIGIGGKKVALRCDERASRGGWKWDEKRMIKNEK